MRLILHIFWKDARRFWPEIGISLAITAVFARVYPVNWVGQAAFRGGGMLTYASQMQTLANVMTGLVPVSWWLLIARAIHAEALVGERQFWVTRPYEWPKLLAAKGLFLAVFLYVPFFAAESALLWEGGFRPWEFVPGLLFLGLLVTGIFVVPLAALAAVTSTLVRMALTIVGIVAAVAAVGFAVSKLDTGGSVSAPYGDRYSIPAILLIGGSAIVVMYARRKAWFARSMLLSLPGIVAAVAISLPNAGMVETAYPLGTGAAARVDVPIQFAYRPDLGSGVKVSGDSRTDSVEVQIPLEAAGVVDGHVAMVEDAMAVVDDGHGTVREMPWTAVYHHYYLRGDWRTRVDLSMKRADYVALKGKLLTLRLNLALTEAKTEAVSRIALPGHDFAVPGFGNCAGIRGGGSLFVMSLNCWTALHGPPLTLVKANLGSTPCGGRPGAGLGGDTGPEGDGVTHVTAWEGSLENDPADVGLTSVWSRAVSLTDEDYSRTKYLCPGTVVSFTRFGLVRRLRTVVTVPEFRLPEETGGVEE